jgi:2-succinyl-5-enolpyruvyl-6-hydroxy-3-cyclohexene-1-carboxylate synthase
VPITATATCCATYVDEWVRHGLTDAVIAPGSRSTPLALALVADGRLSVTVAHDERVASFIALGIGVGSGRPAVLLCTSGTAAAHFFAAVIEADLSSVPMIVCTADRPPELWDIGAAQTVDQTHLYGNSVRFFAEPGVPDAATSSMWRSLASRSVHEAVGASGRPGPVHLNLSFRDPLVGEPGALPAGRRDGAPWHGPVSPPRSPVDAADVAAVAPLLADATDGVIVAGHGTSDPESVVAMGRALGWPVLADPRSRCRQAGSPVVAFPDALLRSTRFASEVGLNAASSVILRFGEPPASKVLNTWLSAQPATRIVATSGSRWSDPDRQGALMIHEQGLASALVRALDASARVPSGLLARWLTADADAAAVIAQQCDGVWSEPSVVRAVMSSVRPGSEVVVSSSMPIRDLEWFSEPRADVRVHANRGANGIDGVVSTAIGVARVTGRPTVCVIGDVAFLHDASALTALARRDIDLRVVVIDNDGGGIFSFLPQATEVAPSSYELLFGTPHGTDLVALASAHGLDARMLDQADDVGDMLSGTGVRVGVARTGGRADNTAVHRQINDAVIAAIDALA